MSAAARPNVGGDVCLLSFSFLTWLASALHWCVQDGGWQLVLLDHGLYRELDDSFRLEYAGLWRSLIFAGKRNGAGVGSHSTTAVFLLQVAVPNCDLFLPLGWGVQGSEETAGCLGKARP